LVADAVTRRVNSGDETNCLAGVAKLFHVPWVKDDALTLEIRIKAPVILCVRIRGRHTAPNSLSEGSAWLGKGNLYPLPRPRQLRRTSLMACLDTTRNGFERDAGVGRY
jgi:hypothetical protein